MGLLASSTAPAPRLFNAPTITSTRRAVGRPPIQLSADTGPAAIAGAPTTRPAAAPSTVRNRYHAQMGQAGLARAKITIGPQAALRLNGSPAPRPDGAGVGKGKG